MQDWGKPRRPDRDRSRPLPRDPRGDSDPPASAEEAPLQAIPPVPSSRPKGIALPGRLAALEAEVERLVGERAHDADQIAEMLVRIAAAERARAAADSRAAAAEQYASALRAEVERLRARCAEIDAENRRARESTRRLALPQADAVRDGITRLGAILDELDRREQMAAGLRSRTMEQVRQALAEIDAPPSPPVLGTPVIAVSPNPAAPPGRDPFSTG
jgi:hypothetical protein